MSVNPDLSQEARKAWRLLTSPLRCLPDFLVPGAPKCGTSTLYDLITAHPDVRRAARKEPTNFIHYPTSALRSRMHFPFSFERTWRGAFLTGEASVEYFFHPEAAGSAAAIIPHAKVIFLLREPIRRAWSDFQMFRADGREKREFVDCVKMGVRCAGDDGLTPLVECASRIAFNPVRYVCAGMYALHLRRWFTRFQPSQTLVLFSEEFYAAPRETVSRVYQFLGLREFQAPDLPIARRGGYAEEPPKDAVAMLRTFYESCNRDLAELLERDLPW